MSLDGELKGPMPIFSVLRTGKHRLNLWSGVVADGTAATSTPSKHGEMTEMDRLQKVGRRETRLNRTD